MKKFKITIEQEIELPDNCTVVEGPAGLLIKFGDLYLSPNVDYFQSSKYSVEGMRFYTLDDEIEDMISGSISSEDIEITES